METTRQELQKFLEIAGTHADNKMKGLRSKAEKRLRETDKRLIHISENGELFNESIDENSGAMDKYSQRIYDKIDETINSLEKPEKFSRRNLEDYAESVRNAMLAQDEILIKYVKLLKGTKYKKRVKSLSKSLQKLNGDLAKFERFIKEDYAPYSDVENTSDIIQGTIEKLEDFEDKYSFLLEKEQLVLEKDIEIQKIEDELKSLDEHPERLVYQAAVNDYNETQKDLDYQFSNLRKALRKYENILAKSREKIDTTLIKELVKDPANCLANQSSLGGIENLLRIIQQQLIDATLQLKRDKREATKVDIEKLLNGELKVNWDKSKRVVKKKEDSRQRLSDLDLDNKLNKMKITFDAAKRDRNRIVEREIRDIENVNSEIQKKIDEINVRLSSISAEDVKIISNFPGIPDWGTLI